MLFCIVKKYFFKNRNPNEQQDNRDRGKVKNIEWIPYENVHKKFLNIGEYKIIT